MYCARILVFIFLVVFSAAAVCASLFPLFRKDDILPNTDANVYYWYTDLYVKVDSSISITRQNSRDFSCDKGKLFFIICSALSVAGAAFGGLAIFMAAAHLATSRKAKGCLCCGISFMCLLAFACTGVCVALSSVLYATVACEGTANELRYKDNDYKLAEGFGLMCAACGGFLLALIFEMCS